LIREEISKRKRFPSMPKGENVGHSGMILSLMSNREQNNANLKLIRENALQKRYRD
jgi:hypothetical protein